MDTRLGFTGKMRRIRSLCRTTPCPPFWKTPRASSGWEPAGGGLGVLDRRTERFSTFQHDGDPGSIGDNLVTFLYEDRERRLWIGTESGGLNRFDRQTRRFVHYRHDAGDPRSIAADDVQAMVQDRDGILWFGTRLAGLDRFDPRTGGFRHFRHSGRDPDSLGDDTVLSLCADATGRLWIGTAKGIEALDRSTFRFSRPQRSPQIGNQVYAIHASGTGDVWMGTQHGLEKLTKDFTVMDYEHDPLNPSSPSSGAVHSILEDRSGVYWFGTDKGADRFSPYSQRFATWGVASAPFRASGNTEAWSFLVNAKGILWIATQNGLGRYDRATGDFKRFAPSARRQWRAEFSLFHRRGRAAGDLGRHQRRPELLRPHDGAFPYLAARCLTSGEPG